MGKTKINPREVEQRILVLLKENSGGVHIQKITEQTGFTRYQIRIALALLEGARKIKRVDVGMAQLYQLLVVQQRPTQTQNVRE